MGKPLSNLVTWREWHDQYDSSPEWRATLETYHTLRRRARINRQLANAVTIGGTSPKVWRGGKWHDSPTTAWAKSHKRRFRQTFAAEIKAARAKLGTYTLPKSRIPIGRTAPRVYRCEAEADTAAADWIAAYHGVPIDRRSTDNDRCGRETIRAMWSLRHVEPSARPVIRGAAARLNYDAKAARRKQYIVRDGRVASVTTAEANALIAAGQARRARIADLTALTSAAA